MMQQPRIIPAPAKPPDVVWATNVGGFSVERYADGSYRLTGADGKVRGRYRDADKLATYFAAWMQEHESREPTP